MKQEKQRQLVKRILTGDKRALRKMYEWLKPEVRGYVEMKVSRPMDVDEIVQDVFLGFLDALPLFTFEASLKTFIYSIARHEVADYWRKKYAKKAIEKVPLISSVYDEALYSSMDTSRDMVEMVERVYEKLKPSYEKILRWKYEESLSVKEIAKRLGISRSAAESRLFRAREAFQEIYVEMFGEPAFAVLPTEE